MEEIPGQKPIIFQVPAICAEHTPFASEKTLEILQEFGVRYIFQGHVGKVFGLGWNLAILVLLMVSRIPGDHQLRLAVSPISLRQGLFDIPGHDRRISEPATVGMIGKGLV